VKPPHRKGGEKGIYLEDERVKRAEPNLPKTDISKQKMNVEVEKLLKRRKEVRDLMAKQVERGRVGES